ncbi:MAG: hypothetical protein P9L90_01475 [Candidatus Aadella gelida]|nr:hypothetical protein [Candidatus Aadella gelida]
MDEMKKLLHKDILGKNPRKHEVTVEETSDLKDSKISKRKTCKYFIRDHYSSSDTEELKEWIAEKQKVSCKKDCHVLRLSNTHTGEEKVVCKVLGDFYVVSGNTAYEVVYMNEIRLSVAEEGE